MQAWLGAGGRGGKETHEKATHWKFQPVCSWRGDGAKYSTRTHVCGGGPLHTSSQPHTPRARHSRLLLLLTDEPRTAPLLSLAKKVGEPPGPGETRQGLKAKLASFERLHAPSALRLVTD